MQCLNDKIDTCCCSNYVGMENRKQRIFAGRFSVVLLFTVIGMTILFSALPASGQYMVQPAKLELSAKVRTQLEPELMIHNLDPNQTNEISLKVVELSQKEDGEWLIYDPDPNNTVDHIPGFDVSKLSSCSSWVKLEKKSVILDPYGDDKVKISMRVPSGTRGCYGAGILCAMKVREFGESQVPFILRVLVPIIIKIETRPPHSDVVLKDVNMEFRDGKTFIKMNIDNEGLTYPRLLPMCRIWALSKDGHYRLIETHEFRDVGILPGVKLALESNIGRSLPSGNYKIIGGVYVDQRPSKKVEKLIDFQGDPTVSTAQSEAPLDLDPLDITIRTKPGSSRSTTLEIHNASEENVTIKGVFGIPEVLASGAGIVSASGQDLTCSNWLKMTPDTFALNSYATRTVRITTDMPESAIAHSNYYAILGLYSYYPDGEQAGTTTANICVSNMDAFVEPQVRGTQLYFEESDSANGQYLVIARFINTGTVHVIPKRCRVGIVDPSVSAVPMVTASLGSRDLGMLLPFEDRYFSEIIDISNLPDGRYVFEVILEYEQGQAERQVQMIIRTEGGVKVPRIERQQEQLPEIFEVTW